MEVEQEQCLLNPAHLLGCFKLTYIIITELDKVLPGKEAPGVFKHYVTNKNARLVRGRMMFLYAPHSRYTE